MAAQVQNEQEDAQRIKAGVAAEEMEVGHKTRECRQLKDEALRELQEVGGWVMRGVPALQPKHGLCVSLPGVIWLLPFMIALV
jgi:hypothetical protein